MDGVKAADICIYFLTGPCQHLCGQCKKWDKKKKDCLVNGDLSKFPRVGMVYEK